MYTRLAIWCNKPTLPPLHNNFQKSPHTNTKKQRGDSMAVAHKSAISIGLLYIPIGLYKTTRDANISFNQLCKNSHERVRYKKYCPSCDKEIKNDDIIKGFEYEKAFSLNICLQKKKV